MEENDDLPYRVEYAKSSRSKCKGCKVGIEKDHIRLAVMIQSPLFDGKMPNWYHFNCFFAKQRPKTVADIAHFESVRWEDQEKIKAKLESVVGIAEPVSAKKKTAPKKRVNQDLSVEYSKSGRALCCGCQEKIVKEDIRIGKMDYDSEEGRRFGGINRWYHLECFVKLRQDLEFLGPASTLSGFLNLKAEDKINLKKLLPSIATKTTDAYDLDTVDGPSSSKKLKSSDTNMKIKSQNKLMFKYRDYLKTLNINVCKELLECNKQKIPESNRDGIFDRLSDAMTFGALLPCDECEGQLVFKSGIGYQCSGYKNEWLKCQKSFQNPARVKFIVPSHLLENDEFLKKYKSKIQNRFFVQRDESSQKPLKINNDKHVARVTRILPLKNMEFATLFKGSELKSLKLKVNKLGGEIVSKCTQNVAAIFALQESIEKKSKKLSEAKELDIEVVEPTTFFDAIDKGGNAIELIVEKNIAPWGGNAKQRIEKRKNELELEHKNKSGLKSNIGKSMYEKSVPTSVKLTLKGGIAVEPQSGLEHKAHVYKQNGEIWNANLCLSDVVTGKNSFYKLQLLQSDDTNRFWLFRSWGRIGTTIGGFKTQEYDTLREAKKDFEHYYEDQTGNMWTNKNNFVKMPGKKVPVDTDYGQDDNKTLDTISNIPCKLPDPVQKLIRLIFDVESMKKVMYEFELDLQKMPLGKLSRSQLYHAYTALNELNTILDSGNESDIKEKTIVSTNKFYSLIPHDFGIKMPQLIDSKEILNEKLKMIESLMEIQIAYNMMDTKTSDEDSSIHPLDAHYLKLNCVIDVLNSEMKEFSIIEQYVKNTHGETHTSYSLNIKDVFKVVRTGEEKRFKPFKKLNNRKLLWHGSRTTNFAAILSQGLRIAPKEAPSTGYMFGKGIYFADMVSKSANYCMASHSNKTGLLLLCEVALGNMDEHKEAEFIEKLPPGKHSCKGIGRTMPDPTKSLLLEDKVEVPLGNPVPSNINDTTLLYNEFIVYDISQVKLRYVVKVEFDFVY